MDKYAFLEKYPVNETELISTGRVPVPYHIYDGQGMLIGGTANLANISKLLETEKVTPIQTKAGKALLGIWVVDFSEASLDPHNELQFSILVSHQPSVPIGDHPLAFLKALFVNPDARMFSYRLWNNTETAVAYNRELLGLNAQITVGTITQAEGFKTFHFIDDDGELLCEGDLRELTRPSPSVGWSLMRQMGLRHTLRAMREPVIGSKVVNPIGERFPANLDAQTYLVADSPVVQYFDPSAETFILNQTYAETFNFQPQFVEHFSPFRFVYLPPQEVS